MENSNSHVLEHVEPCPFCGEIPEVDVGQGAVYCDNPGCRVHAEVSCRSNVNIAIDSWNQRFGAHADDVGVTIPKNRRNSAQRPDAYSQEYAAKLSTACYFLSGELIRLEREGRDDAMARIPVKSPGHEGYEMDVIVGVADKFAKEGWYMYLLRFNGDSMWECLVASSDPIYESKPSECYMPIGRTV